MFDHLSKTQLYYMTFTGLGYDELSEMFGLPSTYNDSLDFYLCFEWLEVGDNSGRWCISRMPGNQDSLEYYQNISGSIPVNSRGELEKLLNCSFDEVMI